MAIATKEQLAASHGGISEGQVKIAKSLRQQNLFLSHSHLDISLVRDALGLLDRHGGRVYVDIADPAGKPLSGPAAAIHVRDAIRRCGRLVVLATDRSHTSRWIPWETGLADGLAGSIRVAVLPVRLDASASDDWAKQEYFGVYPRIEWMPNAAAWGVLDPADRKWWPLAKWIAM